MNAQAFPRIFTENEEDNDTKSIESAQNTSPTIRSTQVRSNSRSMNRFETYTEFPALQVPSLQAVHCTAGGSHGRLQVVWVGGRRRKGRDCGITGKLGSSTTSTRKEWMTPRIASTQISNKERQVVDTSNSRPSQIKDIEQLRIQQKILQWISSLLFTASQTNGIAFTRSQHAVLLRKRTVVKFHGRKHSPHIGIEEMDGVSFRYVVVNSDRFGKNSGVYRYPEFCEATAGDGVETGSFDCGAVLTCCAERKFEEDINLDLMKSKPKTSTEHTERMTHDTHSMTRPFAPVSLVFNAFHNHKANYQQDMNHPTHIDTTLTLCNLPTHKPLTIEFQTILLALGYHCKRETHSLTV
ncbi:hypothetical protein BLNAU_15235 [Blattamonas nauphoetae]|uniref:Uncharacterized protein n=1 Tax=Blattamonas nauphoetae TaxID=2049346 RepID=A0ABQ9XI30_9EUKA|nr:hypothetical protein BLNAU_15235 [Blattamonas nauphoetae]